MYWDEQARRPDATARLTDERTARHFKVSVRAVQRARTHLGIDLGIRRFSK
jgi:hypothetical protein